MSNRSMTDVAYQLLSKKKNSVAFNKLWDEVSQIMGYSENVADRKIASFYTAMMLDSRFTSLSNNKWDLRSRHTYNETHYDTSAIVLDDEPVAEASLTDCGRHPSLFWRSFHLIVAI